MYGRANGWIAMAAASTAKCSMLSEVEVEVHDWYFSGEIDAKRWSMDEAHH